MHLTTFMALTALAHSASAGTVDRRAAFGVARIVEEMSNVYGRNFCYAYISAQPLMLPDYTTVTETTSIFKTITSKTTTTSTDTIGTLRKGTVTSTVYPATVTEGPAHTITSGTTDTITITYTTTFGDTTRTTTLISTVPYPGPTLRKRQDEPSESAPSTDDEQPTPTFSSSEDLPFPTPSSSSSSSAWIVLPSILADSDPLSISTACSRVVTKYPSITISSATTTQGTSLTLTKTFVTTVTKTLMYTQIIPYTTKFITSSGTTTVPDDSLTTTVFSNAETTITTTQTEGPVVTLTLREDCPVDDAGVLLRPYDMINNIFPVPGVANSANVYTSSEIVSTQKECCQRCWHDYTGGQQSCSGYYILPRDAGSLYCMLSINAVPDDAGQNPSCPAAEVGLVMARPENPDWSVGPYREGPCGGGVRKCNLEYLDCRYSTGWM